MCFQQAADQGLPVAQIAYGENLRRGIGVEQDKTKAVEYFQKASDQNFHQGSFMTALAYEHGQGVEKDEKKSLEYLRTE
jgi:TPR repeat protein